MHDRQQLTSRAEAIRRISMLLIPACVLQDKEGSSNTVTASSKETPCLRWLSVTFISLQQ
jgi:hypothetical protein